MKKLLLVAALTACGSAHAWTAYLMSQWTKGGDTFCRYDNGTVLNVGARLCPLTIKD